MSRLLILLGLVGGLLALAWIAAERERSAPPDSSPQRTWRGIRGLSLAVAIGTLLVLATFYVLPWVVS